MRGRGADGAGAARARQPLRALQAEEVVAAGHQRRRHAALTAHGAGACGGRGRRRPAPRPRRRRLPRRAARRLERRRLAQPLVALRRRPDAEQVPEPRRRAARRARPARREALLLLGPQQRRQPGAVQLRQALALRAARRRAAQRARARPAAGAARARARRARAQRDVRLDLLARCLHALGQAGHLEHGLALARRRHDVGVRRVLDALDGGALGPDDQPHHAVGHAHLRGHVSGRAGGRRGRGAALARRSDLREVLGGREDLALGARHVLLPARHHEHGLFPSHGRLDVCVGLGAESLYLAAWNNEKSQR